MSFKSRLNQVKPRNTTGIPAGCANSEQNSIHNRLADIRLQRLQGCTTQRGTSGSSRILADLVNGEEISEGLVRITESLPLDTENGKQKLKSVAQLPPLPGENEPMPCIYIDTETTGLSGGSGTIAFLVGIAYVNNQALNLAQYLITSFSAESSMLAEIESTLPAGYRLASYNGKSFDIPLLQTRYRMKGVKSPFGSREHLDLLHPVRRLFKSRWNDCRLVTTEQQLLGFQRRDDLPGSEAPEAWFNFMRYGKTDKLVRTVRHNRQDIISLPLIHHALTSLASRPDPDIMEITALANWIAQTDPHQARELLLQHSGRICDDGRRLLALLLSKAGDYEKAIDIWRDLAENGCQASLERLTIYHEHRSKDLVAALNYCQSMKSTSARDYRLKRLQLKIRKQSVRSCEINRTEISAAVDLLSRFPPPA